MRSFREFLRATSSRVLLPEQRLRALSKLDPTHIYVENVRAVFGLSTRMAKGLCELAVRQGILDKRVQALCPDQVVAADAHTIGELPPEVRCWHEIDGRCEQVVYRTDSLRKMEYYVFKNEGAV